MPLWRQLADVLRSEIRTGKLPWGRVMPSETTLMQTHGLARGTVRKAIDALEEEGLVIRVQGVARSWSRRTGPPSSGTGRHQPSLNTVRIDGIMRVARGEARPDSDLDLLVDFEPGTFFLITSDCSRILGNSSELGLTSSRGAHSNRGSSTSASKPWICDEGGPPNRSQALRQR